jgi:hypothetical protein
MAEEIIVLFRRFTQRGMLISISVSDRDELSRSTIEIVE